MYIAHQDAKTTLKNSLWITCGFIISLVAQRNDRKKKHRNEDFLKSLTSDTAGELSQHPRGAELGIPSPITRQEIYIKLQSGYGKPYLSAVAGGCRVSIGTVVLQTCT